MSSPVKYNLDSRNICIDCNEKPVHLKETINGVPKFRKVCYTCHTDRRAKRKKVARLKEVRVMAETTAKNNNFETPSEHKEYLAKVNGPYRGFSLA